MDEDSLLLAGITVRTELSPDPMTTRSPKNTTGQQRTIIKPAWLAAQTGTSTPNPQTTSPASEAAPEKKTESDKKAKKRKNSSTTSTPRTQRPRTRGAPADEEEDPDIEMASTDQSNSTNTRNDDDFFKRFEMFMDRKIGEIKNEMKSMKVDINKTVGDMNSKIAANADSIARIQADVSTLDQRIQQSVNAAVHSELSTRPTHDKPFAASHCNNDDDYWRCRRSVRCWPISGPESDLWGLTGDFFSKVLGIPAENLPQTAVQSIRRLSAPRSKRPNKISHEVLVTFKDIGTRDMVFSYAPNLANHRNCPSPPGIRLEYPDRLRGQFQTLDRYGMMMKGELGGNFKRSIKFDDERCELRIDVLFPGDVTWTRIPFDVAREEVQKRQENDSTAARTRISSLSSTGSSQDVRQAQLPPPTELATRIETTLPTSSTLNRYVNTGPARRWGNST